jgi:hypothetical protein
MHVDEVQIDGGGTEAVITGNIENPGKRLIVLEGDEVEALYGCRLQLNRRPKMESSPRSLRFSRKNDGWSTI